MIPQLEFSSPGVYVCPFGGFQRGQRMPALIAAVSILMAGCMTPRRATLIVRSRCMTVNAQSFTRPCVRRPDGKLLCDGVVVTATCVEVSQR